MLIQLSDPNLESFAEPVALVTRPWKSLRNMLPTLWQACLRRGSANAYRNLAAGEGIVDDELESRYGCFGPAGCASESRNAVQTEEASSFLARNEFLIRRLHSLSGLIPVGAYMVVHLITNASVLDSPGTFQRNVYTIHSAGSILPLIEWGFIFLPILFHAILGVVIIRGGLPNSGAYVYASNVRYTLQRVTGMIAFAFIFWHVFATHGWFHSEWWLENVARPLGGAKFKPFNAASTAGEHFQQSFLIVLVYTVGVLSCVFHLANGLWTMGITWGAWVSPSAQKKASWICAVLGVALAVVGMAGIVGMRGVDVDNARKVEDRMYEAKTASGEIQPNTHKRADHDHDAPESVTELESGELGTPHVNVSTAELSKSGKKPRKFN